MSVYHIYPFLAQGSIIVVPRRDKLSKAAIAPNIANDQWNLHLLTINVRDCLGTLFWKACEDFSDRRCYNFFLGVGGNDS